MLGAEIEHLLRLPDPTNQRACQLAALKNEMGDAGRRMQIVWNTSEAERSISLEQLEVGVQVVRRCDRIQDKVEAVQMLFHLAGVLRDDHLVCAQAPGILNLARRGCKQDDVRAESMGELHAHMAQSSESDNPRSEE